MKKEHRARKIKLLKIGITEKEIARMLGVTPQAVNQEMLGEKKSTRIREALCKLTQTPEEKLFPEFYPLQEKKEVA